MERDHDLRLNEIAAPWIERTDAALVFIGTIRTPSLGDDCAMPALRDAGRSRLPR